MPHHTSELCSNPDCNHVRSSHVANRMLCCIVGCPCSNYVETESEQPVEETEQQPPCMPTETSYGTLCNCDAIAGFHRFECPLALSEPVESQTEILHTEPVLFVSIAIVPGALVALDRDGRIWKMPFHNEQWVMINSPIKE